MQGRRGTNTQTHSAGPYRGESDRFQIDVCREGGSGERQEKKEWWEGDRRERNNGEKQREFDSFISVDNIQPIPFGVCVALLYEVRWVLFEPNVRIQWNPDYKAFHRIRCCGNKTNRQ